MPLVLSPIRFLCFISAYTHSSIQSSPEPFRATSFPSFDAEGTQLNAPEHPPPKAHRRDVGTLISYNNHVSWSYQSRILQSQEPGRVSARAGGVKFARRAVVNTTTRLIQPWLRFEI